MVLMSPSYNKIRSLRPLQCAKPAHVELKEGEGIATKSSRSSDDRQHGSAFTVCRVWLPNSQPTSSSLLRMMSWMQVRPLSACSSQPQQLLTPTALPTTLPNGTQLCGGEHSRVPRQLLMLQGGRNRCSTSMQGSSLQHSGYSSELWYGTQGNGNGFGQVESLGLYLYSLLHFKLN